MCLLNLTQKLKVFDLTGQDGLTNSNIPSLDNTAPGDDIFFQNTNDPVKICGISAMLGNYEKTIKEPRGWVGPPSPRHPLFVATDQEHFLHDYDKNNTAWTRIPVNSSLWQEDCKRQEYVGAQNNPCDQPFLFNIAKFYKMQAYRVPQIREAGCNAIVWLDGTVQIKAAEFLGTMADRAAIGENFVVYVHGPEREGFIKTEVRASAFGKYQGRGGPNFGPHQHVAEQYDYYMKMGFREKWFQNETWFDEYNGVDENRNKYGMYVTCMVMFDLQQAETKKFLDCWWEENILRSTQDQVSFPYCAWKHNIKIHALPDAGGGVGDDFGNNVYFVKLGHGKRR